VKWIQLDLGRTEPIEAVRLDALRYDVVEGTGFPRRFKVEAADDPTMAGAIVMADFTEKDFGTPGALRADLPAQPDTAARYLRITATRLRVEEGVACLAFSQVEVISAGKNIAPGATVTASDSVERMPWSAASAVDGLGVPGTNPAGNATRLLRARVQRSLRFEAGGL
jgi:alpha-L-rhamnosidase